MSTRLVFLATSDEGEAELWISDGTEDGTRPFASFGDGGFHYSVLGGLGDKLVFSTNSPGSSSTSVVDLEPWITDGTIAGTRRLDDIAPGELSSSPTVIGTLGGRLYFAASDGDGDREVWSTDGTSVQFVGELALDEGPDDPVSSSPGAGVNIGSYLVFGANDGAEDGGLYSIGAGGSVTRIADVAPLDDVGPRDFARFGDKALFTVPVSGPDGIWVTDGTAGGTFKLMNGNINTISPGYATALGDLIVFNSDGGAGNGITRPYVSDGTVAGTRQLSADVTNPVSFTEYNDAIYFSGAGADGRELWVTDGKNDTRQVVDLTPGAGNTLFASFAVFDGLLFFAANVAGTGNKLYATDGTAEGTVLISDVPADVRNLTSIGSSLFFTAAGPDGRELWVTDGSPGGTRKLFDGEDGPDLNNPGFFFLLQSNDEYDGTPGDDELTGDDRDNVMRGFAGNDTIDGKGGIDRMSGGADDDTYYIDTAKDRVIELFDEGRDTVITRVRYTLPDNVEAMILLGSGVVGTGNALNNNLEGADGAQQLVGLDGNDRLDGRRGADRMNGGAGSDIYAVDNIKDVVFESDPDPVTGGVDLVFSSVSFTLTDNVENLTLTRPGLEGRGNALNNMIDGTDGDQIIEGLAGNDTLSGGRGDDFLDGGEGADTFIADQGNDRYIGGSGIDTIDCSSLGSFGKDAGITVNAAAGRITDHNGDVDRFQPDIERVIGSAYGDEFQTAEDPAATRMTFEGGDGEDVFRVSRDAPGLPGAQARAEIAEMRGGKGQDTFWLGSFGAKIDGGEGRDLLNASTYVFLRENGFGLVIDARKGIISEYKPGTSGFTHVNPEVVSFRAIEAIEGTSREDHIRGSDQAEVILAVGGGDVIDAGGGDDRVGGGDGLAAIFDSKGNDEYGTSFSLSFVNSSSAVTVIGKDFSATGANGGDTDTFDESLKRFEGSRFGDQLEAGEAAQELIGGKGDDTLVALGFNDKLWGGDGKDTADYGGAKQGVSFFESSEVFDESSKSVFFAGPLDGGISLDEIVEVETLIGTAFADRFTAKEWDIESPADVPANVLRDNVLMGGGGNDHFIGLYGADVFDGGAGSDTVRISSGQAATVDLSTGQAQRGAWTAELVSIENAEGGTERDILRGSDVANQIDGGGGNDRIFGFDGRDSLKGGEGDDTISGGLGNDTMDGGGGADTLDYGASAQAITVDLASETASGEGSDTIRRFEHVTGSAFGDTLAGNASHNTLTGGDGDDRLITTLGNDKLVGGKGEDTVDFSRELSGVSCDLGDGLAIAGGSLTLSGLENIIGSKFDDDLMGSSSKNKLTGGDGRDTLNGGTGADTLIGGKGRDTFVYDRRDAMDVITDFRPGEDRLEIDNAIFANLTSLLLEGSLRAARFVSGPAPVATAEAQFLYNTSTGILRFDGDGAGGLAPVLVLKLDNRAALSASDIEII